MKKNSIRIGAGASYAGDRIEPAAHLAEHGDLDYLVFETLAERTIALANVEKFKNPLLGYNAMLEDRFLACLKFCSEQGVKVVTNMGAANPEAALKKTVQIIQDLKLKPTKVAAVIGDDVLAYCKDNVHRLSIMETGLPLSSLEGEIVSANAYLGADHMVEALEHGADIVITGRCADCSLFLAPMMYEFKWREDDWNVLGQGQVCADMLECGANVSGGFFADPGYKEVPDLGNLGYPYIDMESNGRGVISKVQGTGGVISPATCAEQMIYEIHDPSHYITPDVVVDFTGVELKPLGPDRVEITGGQGKARPDQLKVSIGIKEGWIGEAEITYAGLGCLNRARLAEAVVRRRIEISGLQLQELRVDYIGLNSLHGDASLLPLEEPYEVRVRFACRSADKLNAQKLANEVETLVGKGPCASSLPRIHVREVLAIYSVLVPRAEIKTHIVYEETHR
jgi:hypothetical protein